MYADQDAQDKFSLTVSLEPYLLSNCFEAVEAQGRLKKCPTSADSRNIFTVAHGVQRAFVASNSLLWRLSSFMKDVLKHPGNAIFQI